MKKQRKLPVIVIALMLILSLSLAACGNSGGTADAPADTPATEAPATETPAAEAPAEGLKVAFCIQHVNNDFMQGLADYVVEMGKASGVEVTVFAAEQDVNKQVNQVETAITQGFDGIILDAASTDALVPVVKSAQEAGVPIMTLHDDVTSGVADAFVGVDFANGGQIKMEQCELDLGGKGDICIMNGEMGTSAQITIRGGYDPVLDQNPDLNVIFEDTGNWTAEPAAALTETWLASGKNIDAIVCNNDGMALGVVSALKAAGKNGEILVYGLDAQDQSLKEIQEGNMAATIMTDSKGEATAAIDTIIKLINGEPVEKLQLIAMSVINRDNVAEYL